MTVQTPSSTADRNKSVIKWQTRVIFGAVILFIPLLYLSHLSFHTVKYGVLAICLAGLYIAASSIINRVTFFTRWRGMDWIVKGRSEGDQAVWFGILLLVIDIAWIVFIFTPSLSDKYFKF